MAFKLRITTLVFKKILNVFFLHSEKSEEDVTSVITEPEAHPVPSSIISCHMRAKKDVMRSKAYLWRFNSSMVHLVAAVNGESLH